MRSVSIALVVLALAMLMGFLALLYPKTQTKITTAPSIQETTAEKPKEIDFTASFEIYTQGTKRIFTAAMYHNQSEDVYIQNPDPSVIYVKKAGVTWADFFGTLPFSLEKDCLVTGTGQTFCNTETEKLRFSLNGVDTPNALDLEMMSGDKLVVEYY